MYGWTDEYIMSMPYKTFLEYSKCVEPIYSKEAMLMVSVASYPHMSKQGRSDVWKSLKKHLSIVVDSGQNKVKSYKEVAENLARKLRGF